MRLNASGSSIIIDMPDLVQYDDAALLCGISPFMDEAYKPTVRDHGFRRAVVRIYDHRCAFCGVRVMTAEGRTVVDAAHIIPWRVSQNDDPHNGLALCRLCHWTFDAGLIGVSNRYVMLCSSELRSSLNLPGQLVTLDGRGLLGPEEKAL